MKLPKFFTSKYFKVFIGIVIVLLLLRLALPTIVKKYVNKTLAELPGYQGEVEDIDIRLIRGAYIIHGLNLRKQEADSYVPFINFESADISVEWKSLFKGSIVSEITVFSPQIIYIAEDHGSKVTTEKEDWTKAIKDLVPISINRFEIQEGQFSYVEIIPDPNIDLTINQVYLEATNLQNVNNANVKLPSEVIAEGISIGNGRLKISGKINMLREIPDTDIAVSIESSKVTALNDVMNHYADLNFEGGSFSVYSEVAIADGYLVSYLKPLFKDIEIESSKDNLIDKIKAGFANVAKTIVENNETDKVATKVPIEGDLNNSDIGVWCAVWNLFKNAWIEAFKNQIDSTIEFKDAAQHN